MTKKTFSFIALSVLFMGSLGAHAQTLSSLNVMSHSLSSTNEMTVVVEKPCWAAIEGTFSETWQSKTYVGVLVKDPIGADAVCLALPTPAKYQFSLDATADLRMVSIGFPAPSQASFTPIAEAPRLSSAKVLSAQMTSNKERGIMMTLEVEQPCYAEFVGTLSTIATDGNQIIGVLHQEYGPSGCEALPTTHTYTMELDAPFIRRVVVLGSQAF